MTTAPTGRPTPVVAPGVRLAALATTAVGALAVLVALALADAPAVRGALIGAAMVLVFFLFGSVTVNLVAGVMPTAALMVALLTYTLEVVALALVFVALQNSGALESDLDRRWLGLTVIAATLTWTTAQIVGAVRTRIPAYDLPSGPASPQAAPAAHPGGGDSPR